MFERAYRLREIREHALDAMPVVVLHVADHAAVRFLDDLPSVIRHQLNAEATRVTGLSELTGEHGRDALEDQTILYSHRR